MVRNRKYTRVHAGREHMWCNWFRESRSGSEKRHRDRRQRTFWRHEHLSMKMAVATTTHHSYTLCCVIRISIARGAGVLVVARSFASAMVTMHVKFASSKPKRTPVLGDWAFGYTVNVSHQTVSMCVFTLELIRCCRREEENTRYQRFKYLDVTRVAMVPHQLKTLHGQ